MRNCPDSIGLWTYLWKIISIRLFKLSLWVPPSSRKWFVSWALIYIFLCLLPDCGFDESSCFELLHTLCKMMDPYLEWEAKDTSLTRWFVLGVVVRVFYHSNRKESRTALKCTLSPCLPQFSSHHATRALRKMVSLMNCEIVFNKMAEIIDQLKLQRKTKTLCQNK